ncbi:MAG TPA: HlyD family secretion protein [Bacteroidota bacterium]|nr:HlyD family secretion protein [Bacteroidota bacterium]
MAKKETAKQRNIEPQPVSLPAEQINTSPEDEAIESVPLYKNAKLVIPLFIIVLAIAIFSWRYYINLRDFVSTDDAYIDGNRVSISSKILGRIDQLNADEGDTVQQGQLLVRIDDSDLRAQETQTNAALAFAKENIEVSKVSLDKAQTDFQRASVQFRENIIPKEQFDHAQNELEAAKARLNLAYAQATTAHAQLGVVQTQLKNTVIEAPMSGVVSKRWVLAGDVVQPGQAIFSVYDTKDIWVTANLEETNLGSLRVGDKAEISVDTYPDMKFTGTIILLGSNTASQFSLIPPNNASGNFTKVTQRVPVKFSIKQEDTAGARRVNLLPGMSVEVRVKVR